MVNSRILNYLLRGVEGGDPGVKFSGWVRILNSDI